MPARAESRVEPGAFAAGLRRLLRTYLPPALFNAARARFGDLRFEGDYASWADAVADSEGYAADAILARVEHAALAVREGRAAYERDGVLFDQVQHNWPLLANLLWIAARSGNRLHVVDFGGGLGSSYMQNLGMLGALDALHWSVVEQTQFVARGRERFEDDRLAFFDTVDQVVARRGLPNVLLLSGVLQVLDEPFRMLASLLDHGIEFVIVDRTPMIEGDRDRLTVQRVGERLGAASYPAWFFAREPFLRRFAGRYRLREEFVGPDSVNVPSTYQGFVLQRIGGRHGG